MNKNHEVERFDNLMYEGCEPHWHCIHCDNYWPFHCYGKKDLEQMECPARNRRVAKLDDDTVGSMQSLQPCPFCGNKNPVVMTRHGQDGWRDYHYVLCDYNDGGCGASGQWNHSANAAIAAWNRREG